MHLTHITNRTQATLMMMRRAVGCNWGLRPAMSNWLYTRVARPMLVYGSIVWWPKVQQSTAVSILSKVQRVACLSALGAMRSTSTAAMEVVLNLPPLNIFIVGEARMAAYRIQCSGNWKYHIHSKHSRIINVLKLDILEMMPDKMTKTIDLDKPYEVHLVGRDEWSNGEPSYMKNALTWYTDGSKTIKGTGVGVLGVRPKVNLSISLGKLATVFQAEVTAPAECSRINVSRGYRGKVIYINSDSRAALMALANQEYNSKTVWECHKVMKVLAEANKVHLVWVPGHSGIIGNEMADRCANAGADNIFYGPEPACCISYSLARKSVLQWVSKEHQRYWVSTDGNIQTKRLLNGPSKALAAEALSLSRNELRRVVGFITGHWLFRSHLQRIGIQVRETLCRKCGEEEETAGHILFECPALLRQRLRSFDAHESQSGGSKQVTTVKKISRFSRSLGFDYG